MVQSCLIFIHIPKAAGRTLNSVLRRQYPASEIIDFKSLDKPLGHFAKVGSEERAHARLVLGHLHYGIHRWIPGNARYITLVRDPVPRVLSLYGFILRTPRHPLYNALVGSRTSLEEFIRGDLDASQVVNGQTRQIAGVQDRHPTQADLGRALENLNTFAAVGITERFDESLILMRRLMGWRTPYYVSQNVARSSVAAQPLPRNVVDLIVEKNELDVQLYSEALRRLEESIALQGKSFADEVARFKRLNGIVEAVGRAVNPILYRVKRSASPARARRIAR